MVRDSVIITSAVGLTSSPVIISNRLVTSSCAIVADTFGYTANVEKLMSMSLETQVFWSLTYRRCCSQPGEESYTRLHEEAEDTGNQP